MCLAAAADDSATGKPFIVRPGVCEEREDAGTRGGGERSVDEDEIKMRVEGGAEVASLGVEDRGGGARAVEAEDGGAGRMHWFLGMGWDGMGVRARVRVKRWMLVRFLQCESVNRWLRRLKVLD